MTLEVFSNLTENVIEIYRKYAILGSQQILFLLLDTVPIVQFSVTMGISFRVLSVKQ